MLERLKAHPLTALLTVCMLVLVGAPASAQDAAWHDVVQEVSINADGSVIVDDTRTLVMPSTFREAFICLDLKPDQKLTLLEGTGAVSPGPDFTSFVQSCEDGSGGTELVVQNSSRVRERRVRFVYRLDNTLGVYRDVVEWYWQILEQQHPDVYGYQLTVNIPGAMSAPYDAYVHRFGNPEKPRVKLSPDMSTLKVTFERVPDFSGVEIRYLMDPAMFTVKGTKEMFEKLLLDEARVARLQQSWELVRRSPWWAVLPGGVLLGLITAVNGAFRRVGREPKIESMKYPFEPPSDLPPAAVSTIEDQIFNAGRMSNAFHATIMDLMRRGFGEFEPKGRKFEIHLNLDMPTDELLPFEVDVLKYLHGAAASGSRGKRNSLSGATILTSDQLKRYSQNKSSSFMSNWGKKVRKWLEGSRGGQLTTAESQAAAKRWAFLVLLAAAVCAVPIFFTAGAARFAIIAGVALLIVLAIVAGITLPSWRPEIAEEVAGWRGFKRTLTDYTRMKDAPLDFFELWDVYYCYAAALGVAKQYLSTLQRAAPLAGVDESSMVRSAAWMGASSGNFTNLSGLSSSINSLSSSLSAASASASSGGSSSGGGGGGGGGSSGGR